MTLKEIELKQLAILVRHSAKVGRQNLTKLQKTMLNYLEKKYGAKEGRLSFNQFCTLTM